ncbi:serine/threonine-protein kinase-like protein At3g51990 isoform X2 [Hibiscus syriacus]|uniref:serine/threonine-protein kinase-like protein At3g51990 isoform X2 n=1 Tax=Hibiscus syriacus TaxID=106335 RepID=UPI0019207FC0|nr:serine/threonine-protein kinase-like protein At3g51990 isoform X2 [Hibiscus syriacus]
MGYFSCKAESAVSIISTATTHNSSSKAVYDKKEKPLKIQQFDYSDLEAATNGFSDQRLLGKGSHGSVYKAVLKGRHVAIKKPSSRYQETNPETDNEIEILSNIRSPGLVNLLGFSNGANDRLLVVEFMSNGALYDVLHSNSSSRPLNWGRRIRLALQVAKALESLHSQNPSIIHRDVKSANVLIDRNFNARLGDFGLALRCGVDDYRLRSTPPAGTMGYLDPCYVTPDNLSTKTDVFSFGILLLEIISGRKAIDVAHSPPSIVDWAIPLIKKGKIVPVYDPRIAPPADPIVRKQLAVIAAKCVRSCRERRPAMKEVVGWLAGLSKLVPLHLWNGFNNPCMMVETMGRPIECRNSEDVEDGKLGRQTERDSQRVYSDLGFSSNLMELIGMSMNGVEGDCDSNIVERPRSGSRVSGQRFRSKRYGEENGGFGLRRNQSAGETSQLFSGCR